MTDIIKFSKKAYLKLVDTLFEPIDNSKWTTRLISWLIDSKYRTYTRLDKFLKDQLENPDEELVKIANTFKKYKYDKRIVEILKYVYNDVKYLHDNTNYGKTEYWASAIETLRKKLGDCDDINSLIYILARLSGIPSFLLFCAIGNTGSGGHFWTMYFSTKKGLLYPIDGTYYVDLRYIPTRTKFRTTTTKYKDIWYIFNDSYIFKQK
jgi:predicted transglutaminase-like cysteine proteinase